MSTRDELWGWIEVPLEESHARRQESPDSSWEQVRAFFLERLNITDPTAYPIIDALLRDIDGRAASEREEVLTDLDKLKALGWSFADRYAEPEAADTTEPEVRTYTPEAQTYAQPEVETYDQNAWWAFLAECGPGWDGTDEHWAIFEPWLLAEARARGFGTPTEALLAPLRGQGASAVIAVFADYGVVIQPLAAPVEDVRAAEAESEPLPTPEEFAEANMADLLAEDPEFADIPEERRLALIAEVLAEQAR